MTFWIAVNSGAIAVLAVVLYLTIRQLGVLLARLGPSAARPADQGPRIRENIASYTGPLLPDASAARVPTLFVFGTDFCPICGVVRQAARAVAKQWRPAARIVLVFDGAAEVPAPEGTNLFLTRHPTVREQLDIRAVPYAVMTDAAGTVLGHGLVNNASHLESLLELLETAHPAPAAVAVAPGARHLHDSKEGVPA